MQCDTMANSLRRFGADYTIQIALIKAAEVKCEVIADLGN